MIKKIIFALIFFIFPTAYAFAAPVLLTISETEGGQVRAWWPSSYGFDNDLAAAYAQQGVSLIRPAQLSSAPRLSPSVYGHAPLSNINAKTLSSLFGASAAVNGNITWTCTEQDTLFNCTAEADLTLIAAETLPMHVTVSASADSKKSAQKSALAGIAAETAFAIIKKTESAAAYPLLIDKPVMIFNSLPDADTLVAIRKRLKQIPGITDVAELWISHGALAIELNPDAPILSLPDFNNFVQQFLAQTDTSIIVRESKRSAAGVSFDIVKY